MNRYGQMVLEFNRRHRPAAFAQVSDPTVFFDQAGEEIEAAVAAARDEMLGQQGPGEGLDEYRQRSYQALRTAEEIVLADHWLMVPEPDSDPEPNLQDDPELVAYQEALDEIGQAQTEAHQLLADSDQ